MFVPLQGALAEPTWAEIGGLWVALASSLIAAVSAIVVAVQAVQTRKSTQAAREAVEIAQREFKRGEDLRLDALKARIDSEMPRLTLTASLRKGTATDPAESVDPGFIGIVESDNAREKLTQAEYVLPSDGGKQLRVRGTVTVQNDGPRQAELGIRRSWRGRTFDEADVLGVGEKRDYPVERVETVSRWLEAASGEKTSETIEQMVFTMSYRFPGWVGAVDEFRVYLDGNVLDPVPGSSAAWTPADLGMQQSSGGQRAVIAVQPFVRSYFQNRREDPYMRYLD